MHRAGIAILSLFIFAGCAQQSTTSDLATQVSGSSTPDVLMSLRPKADPQLVEKIKQEEKEAQANQARLAQAEANAQNAQGQILPSVSQAPLAPVAPPASEVATGAIMSQSGMVGPGPAPGFSFPGFGQMQSFWPFGGPPSPPTGKEAQAHAPATYNGGYGASVPPPPPEAASGLVPPPPAISLNTQAQTLPPDAYGVNPYANPYGNPYGSPYGAAPGNPYIAQQAPEAAPVQRPSNGLFGTGTASEGGTSNQSSSHRKRTNFVPITPTGMEARSPSKQRDDLKILVRGALNMPPLQDMAARDAKIAQALNGIDVGLPQQASKGVANISQRQLDTLFKSGPHDKHITQQVGKMEADVAQVYYRYLYAFNRFALAQQTVAARKQETELAADPSEQQKAAADYAQAQNDAEQAKQDIGQAQLEMASVCGASAASSIIAHTSGISPNPDPLTQAENQARSARGGQAKSQSIAGDFFGGVTSFFKNRSESNPKAQPASESPKQIKPENKKPKLNAARGQAADLTQAPQTIAARDSAQTAPADAIFFKLKDVNITPRKSVLKVSVKNNSPKDFTFDPDAISIAEGPRKISEASLRADFATTVVKPNQEINGTITIYGHPWSDRISVVLPGNDKTVQLIH